MELVKYSKFKKFI